MKVPDAVGVPLMVIVLVDHDAVTPAGSPVAVPIPIAPVVVCVMLVNAVFIQSVGVLDAVPAVLFAVTVIVPIALSLLQFPVPPVNGIL